MMRLFYTTLAVCLALFTGGSVAEAQNSSDGAGTLVDKANQAMADSNLVKALVLFKDAINKAKDTKDALNEAKALNGLGWVYQRQAELPRNKPNFTALRQQQRDTFQKSVDFQRDQAEDQQDPQLRVEASIGLAEACMALNGAANLDTALASYTEAWAMALDRDLLRAEADAMQGLSQVEGKLNNAGMAATHKLLHEQIVAQSADPIDETAETRAAGSIGRLLDVGNVEDAFLEAQRDKQHELRILLQPAQSQDIASLLRELQINKDQLKQIGVKNDPGSKTRRQVLETDRARIIRELLRIHLKNNDDADSVRLYNHPELSDSKALRKFVQDSLPAETTILEYYVATYPTRKQPVIFIVRKGPAGVPLIKSVKIKMPLDQIESAAKDYRGICQDLNSKYWQAGFPLYQALVTPVLKELEGTKHLIVCPHKEFWGVPFGALPVKEVPGKFDCLLFQYPLSYDHSTVQALACQMAQPIDMKSADALFLVLALNSSGDPALPALRYAEKEGQIVTDTVTKTKSFPSSRLRFYPGPAATKQRLLREGVGKGFWHISSHGVFVKGSPLQSYFALAKAPSVPLAESRMTAKEIMAKKLPLNMVTLSACDLGLVDATGDGILGMSGAFQQAGVLSQVLSLYRVSDTSTPLFMQDFYSGLLFDGRPKDEALQAAARATVEVRGPHPYFWGAFFLIGNTCSIQIP